MKTTELRYVWYVGNNEAQSYASLAEGQRIHGRDPDAQGHYWRHADGTLEHEYDIPIAHGTLAGL